LGLRFFQRPGSPREINVAEHKENERGVVHVGIDDLEGTFTIKVKARANLSLEGMADVVKTQLSRIFDQIGEIVDVKVLYGSVIHDGEAVLGKPKRPEIDEDSMEVVREMQEAISTFQGREITEDVLRAAGMAVEIVSRRMQAEGRCRPMPNRLFQLVKDDFRIRIIVMSGSNGYYREVYRG
jgi:hypothetical protein